MYHFFVEAEAIGEKSIRITGEDVNHIKNVLRLKCDEQIIISRRDAKESDEDYYCSIAEIASDYITANIDWTEVSRELKNRIYLFQGLPKADKMELIIQKAVELGVYEIIPVNTERCVVKLDGKKEENKIKRWQAISESAAKQSKRSIIPEIKSPMKLPEVFKYAKEQKISVCLIPYEAAKEISHTRKIISGIETGQPVAVLIGPEGGFAPQEVEAAIQNGFTAVTLGRRILRTETAGIMMLSVLMYSLED